jgi:glycine/D-amino acid oxidase-like deaminating enzyme
MGRAAVSFANQALFHPPNYLVRLAKAVHGDGSLVFEYVEVGEVMQHPLAITVNGEMIACDDVILATHVPLAGSAGFLSAALFQTNLYPYSSYVLGARMDHSLAPALYDDTAYPYYYLRVHETDGQRYANFRRWRSQDGRGDRYGGALRRTRA